MAIWGIEKVMGRVDYGRKKQQMSLSNRKSLIHEGSCKPSSKDCMNSDRRQSLKEHQCPPAKECQENTCSGQARCVVAMGVG